LRLEALSSPDPRAGANPQAALRADIRRLGDLLEQSLARQEGPELPALVARIRGLTERSLSSSLQAGEELRALLDGLDLGTTIRLVRALSSHSRLATVAQQVHQVGELADLQHHRVGRLGQTVDRILDEGESPQLIKRVAGNLEMRPVFTAHPTEAARRSMLTKLRQVAGLLVQRSTATTVTDAERTDRRIAEVIDAMWQTDELRQGKPEPLEEGQEGRLDSILADHLRERTDAHIVRGKHVGDHFGSPFVEGAEQKRRLEVRRRHVDERRAQTAQEPAIRLGDDAPCVTVPEPRRLELSLE